MRIIKEYTEYPPIHKIFERFQNEKDAVFLDSSLQNELGKFSVIGVNPYLRLVNGEEFTVNGHVWKGTFEEYVKEYLQRNYDKNETELPIVSGAIGYFSYDYGRKKMGVCSQHNKQIDIPECILNFYKIFIIEDHKKQHLYLIINEDAEAIEKLSAKMEKKILHPAYDDKQEKYFSNFTKEDYMKAIQDMIHYIVEGDIYIANMTHQMQIKSSKAPFEVFMQLRKKNPSPFGGYLNYGDFQVVSASPERFLKIQNGHVMTRPIKGTRKRGDTQKEDQRLRQELADSEKDKSELLMIVDLERNDLNKVCRPGTVKVTDLFTIEEYATVFHLTAGIEGWLRDGLTPMDLLEAAFPGGSITGAPKLRAMEIIDELEHDQRNLYTGSMGYLTLDGSGDLNIVIRTAIYQDGIYHLGVGGGITSESDLEFEYEETMQKAKAILEVLV